MGTVSSTVIKPSPLPTGPASSLMTAAQAYEALEERDTQIRKSNCVVLCVCVCVCACCVCVYVCMCVCVCCVCACVLACMHACLIIIVRFVSLYSHGQTDFLGNGPGYCWHLS